MSEKKVIDWERIEVEYRAGIDSLREIASRHGIAESAIRKRAKRDSWERDLTAKIKAKTESLVRKELVRSTVRTETATEKEVVEANAQNQAQVIILERKDTSRGRALTMKFMDELEAVTDNKELFEHLGEIMNAPDDKGMDKLNEIYRKVISLSGRIDSGKKIADMMKTFIDIERKVHGIDDSQRDSDGDHIAALRRLDSSEQS